ncbi:hypothetical protein G9A89_019379 [Geosiphon pyriformis]|nr:hypothetical protein G9A89_019379 [Geosiphon pyriformis]
MVQQPIESDLKEYEYGSNNLTTAQDKSTVNKKPRVLFPTTPSYHQTLQSRIVFNPLLETQSETLQTSGNSHSWNQHSWTKSLGEYGSLFGNLISAAGQTKENMSTWEQPLTQNLAESASPLMEKTAILQPIGLSNKGKQPVLALGEHSNTQTPTLLNITNITKLEKFLGEEDNMYLWIAEAEKAITADSLPRGIPAIKLRKKLTKLRFRKAMDKTITIKSLYKPFRHKSSDHYQLQLDLNTKLQRTSTNTNLKVAESENIGTNYLGFAKFLFQYYCQHLELNHNHISVELAFNFYVNKRIAHLLETPVNIELTREAFYSELIQNTNLPTNHNFASIITEINKEIEHHTQQRYPITYASKGKEKLQTPAKTRVEFPTNPLYHYTLGNIINITSTSMATSNMTSAFGQFPFQKNPEIETPNFQTQSNLDNSENDTPNIQTPPNQNNPNSKVINQHLPLSIQPPNQQNQQLPPQQQMAYAPIMKLNKFNGEENDAQVWLNNMAKAITANNWDDARVIQDTADAWYQSLVVKPQNFNGFKTEFLQYFSNNNSINKLANTFTTIRQGDTEAVTTYLEHFHRNLYQIQVIQADYFIVPQILNQFIRRLHSSILQQVCPMHLVNLLTAVTYARDFEAAELEANHTQAESSNK